jgi:hypothetical protein
MASASLTFASLFLGLLMGLRPVRVLSTGPVAAVAYDLDGREVGRLDSAPWIREIDFGPEYAPHELVVRGLDAAGKEIARARQWINLPRPPAEVQVLLEKDVAGTAVAARLAWASRTGPVPESAALTFDGRPMVLSPEGESRLPVYDPSLPHVLTAHLSFPGLHSRMDLALGGGASADTGRELTAVPLRSSHGSPSLDALRRLRVRGETARVHSISREPAEVVVVRSTDSGDAFRRLGVLTQLGPRYDRTMIGPEDRLRVQWPVSTVVADGEGVNVLFEGSDAFPGATTSLATLLLQVAYPKKSPPVTRFADAVAVAGLQASAGGSRRAVVLVLGTNDRDDSRCDPGCVKRYLERLRVPLHIWSLSAETPVHWGRKADDPAAAWGEFRSISNVPAFRSAVDVLRKDIESQWVVWVEGRFLPQEIELAEGAAGIDLVR